MAKKREYGEEFRREVAAYKIDGGKSVAQTARDFGLVAQTVSNWVKDEEERRLGSTEEARDASLRARVAELEAENRRLAAENAFAVKCAAFFAKELR